MIIYGTENFSINQIILENISLFENSTKEKEIKLEAVCVKKLNVFTDKNIILTVFRNLISNAVKFTQKKGTSFIFTINKNLKNSNKQI